MSRNEDPMTRSFRRWALLSSLTLAVTIAAATTALVQRNQVRAQLERGQREVMQLLVMLDDDMDGDVGGDIGGHKDDERAADLRPDGDASRSRLRHEATGLAATLSMGARRGEMSQLARLSAALRRAAEEERGARAMGGYEEALELARPLEKSDEPAVWQAVERAYRLAGSAALRRGEHEEARGLLDRAVLLGGRLYLERPAAQIALVLAASHGLLARLEAALGEAERSEQQWRFALELYETWRGRGGESELFARALVAALTALGDLEMERQRRAGARGFYDRAMAMATALRPGPGATRRGLLLELGLRRMERGLGGSEQCLMLLELVTPPLLIAEGEAGWREASAPLVRWIERCPRLGGGGAAARRLATSLQATMPRGEAAQQREKYAALGRLWLALGRGDVAEERWDEARMELNEARALLEAALDGGVSSDVSGASRASGDGEGAGDGDAEARRALLALFAVELELPGLTAAAVVERVERCRLVGAAARWRGARVECAMAAARRQRGAARMSTIQLLRDELTSTAAADDESPERRRHHLDVLLAVTLALAESGEVQVCSEVRALERRAEELLQQAARLWGQPLRSGSPAPPGGPHGGASAPLLVADATERVTEGLLRVEQVLRAKGRCAAASRAFAGRGLPSTSPLAP